MISLDVLFGTRRVWSFVANGSGELWFPWPAALRERLYGHADVEVRNSSTGVVYASKRLQFDRSQEAFVLEDREGRPLMINKWQRLSPMLADGAQTDKRSGLVRGLVEMRDTLANLGYQVIAVGGTALGPYRDGDLLPHDDDGDLGVFIDCDSPIDIAREMLRIERQLRQRGFRVRTHSHAHLQVYPRTTELDPKLYVDVFAVFLKGDTINQPFPVRGKFRRDQLFPLGSVKIRSVDFSVPRDIEGWFEINYGGSWRTPQPGFSFNIPSETTRRFDAWFGSFNLHRHFWERHANEGNAGTDYKRLSFKGLPFKFESSVIVNLGSGINPLLPASIEVGVQDATLFALDYADSVRTIASEVRKTPGGGEVIVRDLNFANYHAVLNFVAELPSEPFDLYAGFAIEGQDPNRRNSAFWRFARMALMSGGKVVIDHLDELGSNYSFEDPRSWHLDSSGIFEEAAVHGMNTSSNYRGSVQVAGKRRRFTRSVVSLNTDPASPLGDRT